MLLPLLRKCPDSPSMVRSRPGTPEVWTGRHVGEPVRSTPQVPPRKSARTCPRCRGFRKQDTAHRKHHCRSVGVGPETPGAPHSGPEGPSRRGELAHRAGSLLTPSRAAGAHADPPRGPGASSPRPTLTRLATRTQEGGGHPTALRPGLSTPPGSTGGARDTTSVFTRPAGAGPLSHGHRGAGACTSLASCSGRHRANAQGLGLTTYGLWTSQRAGR